MHHEGVYGSQWDKETLFSHWVDIHTQMVTTSAPRGMDDKWMVNHFFHWVVVCAYASSPLQQSSETKRKTFLHHNNFSSDN
jgi:hypothetical protein